MRQAGLETKYKRKYVVTTKSNHDYGYVPNVLNREFQAEKPNQKWVSDITYLPTTEGWLYMATIMDLFSRRIIGWAFSTSLETEIVIHAFTMAKQQRKPTLEDDLIYHSDRGVQYASLSSRRHWQNSKRPQVCQERAIVGIML
jgi:putative transposase